MVEAGEEFEVEYDFTASDTTYPYEIRTFSVLGELRECVYNENIIPDCVVHTRSFTTECPAGGPPAVEYTVGCLSSSEPTTLGCGFEPDTRRSCTVNCPGCTVDRDLVFNVTAPVDYVSCTLHLWYNTSEGIWCKLLPEADTCAGAYGTVTVEGPVTTDFHTNILQSYRLRNIRGPARYKWNVQCVTHFGQAMAQQDWTFTVKCPMPSTTTTLPEKYTPKMGGGAWKGVDDGRPPSELEMYRGPCPPTCPTCGETEYSPAEEDAISSDDSQYVTASSDGVCVYAGHRLLFNILEDRDSIDIIDLTVRGYGSCQPPAPAGPVNGLWLYVWNHTANSWGANLSYHKSANKDTLEAHLTDINDYVDADGELYALAVGPHFCGTAGNAHLYYAEAEPMQTTSTTTSTTTTTTLAYDLWLYYYVEDAGEVDYCDLYGDFTGGWGFNQRSQSVVDGTNAFVVAGLEEGSSGIWNVLATDTPSAGGGSWWVYGENQSYLFEPS